MKKSSRHEQTHIKTRFAPSPTGPLHVGGARTALFNFLYAHQNGGAFIVRVEDTDRERSTSAFEQDIHEGLSWLGITPDTVYRQSERGDIYRKHISALLEANMGYVSNEERDGRETSVIRFRNPGGVITFTDEIRGEITMDVSDLGDFVIARSETEPLYHLAVVIDDAEMGITHIIRGEDHISNTPRQILLQQAIGAQRPVYAHLPLILAPDKSKLSKRHGAVSVNEYAGEGYLADALVNFLALLGWSPQGGGSETAEDVFSREELRKAFSLDHIQKGGAVFDIEKLRWINRQHLGKLSEEDKTSYLMKHLPEEVRNAPQYSEERLSRSVPLIFERIDVASDIEKLWQEGEFVYLFTQPDYETGKLSWKDTDIETTRRHLTHVRDAWSNRDAAFSADEAQEAVWDYASEQGRGSVLWPVRFALSGREKSAGPFAIAAAVGRDEALVRLDVALEKLSR